VNRAQRRAMERGKPPPGVESMVQLTLSRDEASMVEEALQAYRVELEALIADGFGNPAMEWAADRAEQLRVGVLTALRGGTLFTGPQGRQTPQGVTAAA
jgi:predicted alpha/beta-hydrolase family hydrolase